MRDNPLAGTALVASGVGDADAILNHLTSGKAHPIANHIRGLRSAAFRPQHAPANEYERFVQRIVVGAARALQQSGGKGLNVSIRTLVEGVCKAGSEFQPTEAQVKGWHYAFDRDRDPGPDVFAQEIIDPATAHPKSSVLQEAVWIIFEHAAVASPLPGAPPPV